MKKLGKRLISHRYDRRTLARFRTWGIGQELVVWDLPDAKIGIKNTFPNFYVINKLFISHPASGNPINKLVISWLFRTRARLRDTRRFSCTEPVYVKHVLLACFTMQNFYFPIHYLHILDNQAHCTLIGTDEISTFSRTFSESSIPWYSTVAHILSYHAYSLCYFAVALIWQR